MLLINVSCLGFCRAFFKYEDLFSSWCGRWRLGRGCITHGQFLGQMWIQWLVLHHRWWEVGLGGLGGSSPLSNPSPGPGHDQKPGDNKKLNSEKKVAMKLSLRIYCLDSFWFNSTKYMFKENVFLAEQLSCEKCLVEVWTVSPPKKCPSWTSECDLWDKGWDQSGLVLNPKASPERRQEKTGHVQVEAEMRARQL